MCLARHIVDQIGILHSAFVTLPITATHSISTKPFWKVKIKLLDMKSILSRKFFVLLAVEQLDKRRERETAL